ncbi:MAG TPA: UDP-N-acetylmuramate dehydrogenase [Candidatus Pullilachnospira stercoravium]|uniref:UDP-N-acetylenolpyruvoylglucosamine reductase n=1 Tax=Candidatus Pullilachnospira stercoravium TaxID=2840913 RepID=A0A9D1T6E3_9FIRM|nr:UDP-N-acetylmuramate dehydrogenase [Candidatus Pullilachnospira stercoravium]
MNKEIVTQFQEIAGTEQVLIQEPMKNHTTFRIGGPAACFVRPQDAGHVERILHICRENEVPWFILGNGSNLLVSDRGFDGVIIQIYRNMSRIQVSGHHMTVQAGALLSAVAKQALREGLSGLEFASGIPGTVGGAVVMNAGAYGGEMKDVVESVTVLDEEGAVRKLAREELQMGYRTSLVKKKGYTVLEAVLKLNDGDPAAISARMEELKEQRVSKQPLEYPSAGSTFKRPEGYFAGKLIMDSGLRGFRVGGAQISEKHCGFVINTGDATAEDVVRLIRQVQDIVYEKFHVKLEPEVRFLGIF